VSSVNVTRRMTRAVRIPGPDTVWYDRRIGRLLGRLAVGIIVLLLWWVSAELELMPRAILPTPLSVLLAFIGLLGSSAFWLAVAQTLSAALSGLGLALVVGVPLGLVLGLVPAAERSTRLLLDIGRSFPVIALLPVLILVLGVTFRMEVTVVFLGVLWPILLQTIYGSRRLDPVVRDTTRSYRINLGLRFSKVLLPAAAPFTMTGVRVAASIAILLSIAVEILGRTPGMGLSLGTAQLEDRPDISIAYLFAAGFLGLGLNTLLQLVEDRLLVWNARGDQAGGAGQ